MSDASYCWDQALVDMHAPAPDPDIWHLRLYVAGESPPSLRPRQPG